MKKFVFFIVFLLFTGTNSVVISLAVCEDEYQAISMPLGDSEESPGEESKNFSEEDDDDSGLEHYWSSKNKSSNSNLHYLYQEIIFRDLKIEVVIPPPKA